MPRHGILRLAGSALLVIAVLYLAAVGYLYFFQESFVYKPTGILATPVEDGLPQVEVITMEMADGTELTGWYQPAAPGLPTILYFQGNSGNISTRASRFQQIVGSDFGLLAVGYRGYAGSGGRPSQDAIFSDALAIFDWLAERTDDIVLHGESLGTGVAAYTASQRQPKALVLEAPFTAAVDVAAATYPWVPVGMLMRDQYLSRVYIKDVSAPVLIVHGTDDQVIPVEYGEKLYGFANEPKSLFVIQGARHGDLWANGLWPEVLEFLKQNAVLAQPAPWVLRMPSLAG